MAGARVKVQFVKLFQLANAFQRRRAERRLTVKGVQHDALEQVSQRHVVILGKRLQNLEDSLFDAHPGLHAFNQKLGIVRHAYQCTMVPIKYLGDGLFLSHADEAADTLRVSRKTSFESGRRQVSSQPWSSQEFSPRRE